MAMKWAEFTSYRSGGKIFLNMVQASSIERGKSDKYTVVGFLAGQDDGYVKVVETVEQVLSSLGGRDA